MVNYRNLWGIAKAAMLLFLVALTFMLSTIDNISLNTIYATFGDFFHIDWKRLGLNFTTISNAGHGISAFCLCFAVTWNLKCAYWRCALIVLVFFSVNELLQFFIPTRQASVYDIAYSIVGVSLALVILVAFRSFTARSLQAT